MPGRIVVRNRVAVGARVREAPAAEYNKADPAYFTRAIPPDHPSSPYREGVPVHDPEDDVVYRRVSRAAVRADPTWVRLGFWTQRWGCRPADVHDFCRRGLVDAAYEDGTHAKLFRCRDERAVQAALQGLREAAEERARVRREVELRRVAKAQPRAPERPVPGGFAPVGPWGRRR